MKIGATQVGLVADRARAVVGRRCRADGADPTGIGRPYGRGVPHQVFIYRGEAGRGLIAILVARATFPGGRDAAAWRPTPTNSTRSISRSRRQLREKS